MAVLVGIPLETGQKQYSVDYKLETYLKIARLFLEDDDPIQAEAYINRASLLQGALYSLYVVFLLRQRFKCRIYFTCIYVQLYTCYYV